MIQTVNGNPSSGKKLSGMHPKENRIRVSRDRSGLLYYYTKKRKERHMISVPFTH